MPDQSLPRQTSLTLEALQAHVGGCRQWVDDKMNCCFAPAEYVLWGKLIDEEGLGPRCYDHAEEHVGHYALMSRSGYAVINLRDLAADIDAAKESPGEL